MAGKFVVVRGESNKMNFLFLILFFNLFLPFDLCPLTFIV